MGLVDASVYGSEEGGSVIKKTTRIWGRRGAIHRTPTKQISAPICVENYLVVLNGSDLVGQNLECASGCRGNRGDAGDSLYRSAPGARSHLAAGVCGVARARAQGAASRPHRCDDGSF